jgi:hypothetical protein
MQGFCEIYVFVIVWGRGCFGTGLSSGFEDEGVEGWWLSLQNSFGGQRALNCQIHDNSRTEDPEMYRGYFSALRIASS